MPPAVYQEEGLFRVSELDIAGGIRTGRDRTSGRGPGEAGRTGISHRAWTPYGLVPDSLTDRGNAKLFVGLHPDAFRYVPGLGWYRWSGYRWESDAEDAVMWALGDMAEALAELDVSGRHRADALSRSRRRALSTSGMLAILRQVKAAPGITLNASALDTDPYALCTPGGVVNLLTGRVTPADPARHCHARATSVAPAAVPVPRWLRFLTDTFGTDPQALHTIEYMRRLLGYSLTGDVGAQVMPFLLGAGNNGKSVLVDVVVRLLGDYADAAPPGFLMERPFQEHLTDLAELHGRRVVVCAEVKPEDRFDGARVKLLTGGDRIKARRMRQDFFTFEPTHKIWLLGNHRPDARAGDQAFWRRIRVIPFDRMIRDDRRMDNLSDVLVTEEGPGILHWLITGARRYLNGSRDLTGSRRVREATAAYAESEDHVGRFLSEHARPAPSGGPGGGRLYAAYRAWCRTEGDEPLGPRSFAARVGETSGAEARRRRSPTG